MGKPAGWTPPTEGADYVFLPAWTSEYSSVLDGKLGKPVVVWTSPIIQSEYEPMEFLYLKEILRLLDKGKIYAVWFGSQDWLPIVKKEGRRVFYCPYPVTLPPYWKGDKTNNPPKEVGIFGPMGPRKNAAVQAMAAVMAGCRVHFTDPGMADRSLLLPGDYAVDGWQIPARYHDLVLAMDVGMQCSIPGSESFSYVTWDFVSRDVPCLTTVPWILHVSGSLHIRNPYDIEDLANHIRYAADMYDRGELRTSAELFSRHLNEDVRTALFAALGLAL